MEARGPSPLPEADDDVDDDDDGGDEGGDLSTSDSKFPLSLNSFLVFSFFFSFFSLSFISFEWVCVYFFGDYILISRFGPGFRKGRQRLEVPVL